MNEDKRLELKKEIAKGLLDIEAVFLRPEDPFTWASGIKSPIYCDNRLILTDMPMGYVRSGNKDHGRGNRIEGKLLPGQKVVVVEDLISTGGSAIEVVEALREAGAEVLGIVSIFTYGMEKGLVRMADANVKNFSLSDFDTIVQVAAVKRLLAFRSNPQDESWIRG